MADFSKFTENQWQRLLDRLTIYAERRYMRLGWFRNGKYRSPSGQGPEDVASEAIVRLIEGKRNYDEQKYPDLLVYLRSVVKSIISHIIDSAELKRKQPMPLTSKKEGETEEVELESKDSGPLQMYIDNDLVEKIKLVLNKRFAQDIVVSGILECMEAGIDKRSEIADYVGVKVKEVYNAQKRLQREFDKIRSDL